MPRQRSNRLSLSQRRDRAAELFDRGFTNRDIAYELGVHANTVTSYKKWWEERNAADARGNPEILRDVVGNTLRLLREADDIRANLWKDYHAAESGTTRATIMGQILKAQEQRGKLLGLMGLKQEWFINLQNIIYVKDRLIEFMSRNLCPSDRAQLERLLTGELAEYVNPPNLMHPQMIDAEARVS